MITQKAAALLAWVFVWLVGTATPMAAEMVFVELASSPQASLPPVLGGAKFPIQLIQDDDTAEGAFGVGGTTARQFLWFQSFPAEDLTFELREIWVLFPADSQLAAGTPIQLVVYRDADGDPTTGAELLRAADETVLFADDSTFSIYPLAEPLTVRSGGEILIGVINRYVESGVSPQTLPAALDTSSSAGRSWVATWTGDPPDPPVLPSDQDLLLIDTITPGNWMIRGFGTSINPVEIPALDGAGLALMALFLALAGVSFTRSMRIKRPRRPKTQSFR